MAWACDVWPHANCNKLHKINQEIGASGMKSFLIELSKSSFFPYTITYIVKKILYIWFPLQSLHFNNDFTKYFTLQTSMKKLVKCQWANQRAISENYYSGSQELESYCWLYNILCQKASDRKNVFLHLQNICTMVIFAMVKK